MEAQRTDWVDAIRYFRGLGRPRRHRVEAVIHATGLVMLAVLTALAALAQFG